MAAGRGGEPRVVHDGLYRILSAITFSGDTRGTDWYADPVVRRH